MMEIMVQPQDTATHSSIIGCTNMHLPVSDAVISAHHRPNFDQRQKGGSLFANFARLLLSSRNWTSLFGIGLYFIRTFAP
jgi:hypothetical protein